MKRKLTAWFVVLAIWVLFSTTAQAQETTLKTVVPSSHTVHLTQTGEGIIFVDGVIYTKTTDMQVQRKHRPEISILAVDGSEIKTVLWNSEDVTAAFQNGKWTAPEILNDASLTVTFEKSGNIPRTGDIFHPKLWFDLLIISMFGLAVCLLQSKKKCI